MPEQRKIIDCYDAVSKKYAENFMDELSKKHFDRILLKSFVLENTPNGAWIDLGCGPGQTTKFLYECGIKDIRGVDISPEMIRVAQTLNPKMYFETGDMLKLKHPDRTFDSAIAFYSIVHFSYEQVAVAFKEIKRVLKEGGQLLFSFHVGTANIYLDNFLEQPVSVEFCFFEPAKIKDLLLKTGFKIIDILIRQPYQDVEYQSERAYIWAKCNC